MRFRAGVSLALAALIGLLAAPAHATLSEALSLRDLVTQAEHVVRVTCVGEEVLRDGRMRIVTDYTVRVDETLAGRTSPGESLTMRRLGGELGDLGMRIEGEPSLEVGQRYVLFLYSAGAVLRPVGMSQGVLPVSDDRGALLVHPGGAGLALVQRGANGQLRQAPAALLHDEPWERLRERVSDVIREAP